jgi:hypothetical protein
MTAAMLVTLSSLINDKLGQENMEYHHISEAASLSRISYDLSLMQSSLLHDLYKMNVVYHINISKGKNFTLELQEICKINIQKCLLDLRQDAESNEIDIGNILVSIIKIVYASFAENPIYMTDSFLQFLYQLNKVTNSDNNDFFVRNMTSEEIKQNTNSIQYIVSHELSKPGSIFTKVQSSYSSVSQFITSFIEYYDHIQLKEHEDWIVNVINLQKDPNSLLDYAMKQGFCRTIEYFTYLKSQHPELHDDLFSVKKNDINTPDSIDNILPKYTILGLSEYSTE